jgi:hypothetical protein
MSADDVTTNPARERDIMCPREVEFVIAGEAIVVRPLVLRDFKAVGDRLAAAYARLAENRDLSRVGVLELVPLALAELPDVLALALKRRGVDGLEPVDPTWLEQNVSAVQLLDVIDAVLAVNDLPGILKNCESLRRQARVSPAGD